MYNEYRRIWQWRDVKFFKERIYNTIFIKSSTTLIIIYVYNLVITYALDIMWLLFCLILFIQFKLWLVKRLKTGYIILNLSVISAVAPG